VSFQLPYDAEADTLAQDLFYWLNGSYMGLLAASFTVVTSTTLADCIGAECTFTGYSRYLVNNFGVVTIDGSGAAISLGTGYFTPTGGGGSGNVYGYFLTDSSGDYFYGVEVFASPLSAPTGVQIVIPLTYSVLARYGPT
jgi:hypothetical protein